VNPAPPNATRTGDPDAVRDVILWDGEALTALLAARHGSTRRSCLARNHVEIRVAAAPNV